MKNYKAKQVIALFLIILMSFSILTGFANQDGFGTVTFQSKMELFDGMSFGEIVGYNSGGIQHAYIVEADNNENGIRPMVFSGEVRATYTVADMIRYAEEQGYKVVAAINGDIYDTATGTPKGLTISNGNIVTSGYNPEMSLTFDQDGKAAMLKTSLSYSMKGIVTETIPTPAAIEGTSEGAVEGMEGMLAPQAVDKEISLPVGFINVPQGAANGLHFYNRHYGTSTKTNTDCVEIVIDTGSKDNIQLKVNSTIKGIVKSVNPKTRNTPIGETEVVLSTVLNSATASKVIGLKVGSEIEISAQDQGNEGLSDVREALGIYYSIVADGRVDTTGTNPNPRTAVGIRPDGSLLLYVLDGRQPAVSNGLGLIDTAKHLIALDCVSGFNMDGGGSSVLYARLPGVDGKAVIRNSPSQLSQRKVANGLLLVYKDTASSTAEHLHLYPGNALLMAGADIQITPAASNRLYEKTGIPGSVSYSVTDGLGTISSSGLFTAGTNPGKVTITGSVGNLRDTTEVEIIHPSNLTLKASVSKLNMDIGQTAEIDMTARMGYSPVITKDSLFAWSCDENIGTINQEGEFKAVLSHGQKGNIYIGYNGSQITIPVTVGKELLEFADTTSHWAKEYIGKLASRGLVEGVGDNMFMPDANITRAQFLAMLGKTMNGNLGTDYRAAGFQDVKEGDWYYHYVNWGFASGIVSGLDEKTFAPNDNITREQMSIMLCNFSRLLGFAIPQTTPGILFPDSSSISPWAADYVATVVGGGIMNGDSSGSFYPQGLATRAQAAKVIYVYTNLRSGIE
jgi:hypothetical protein